MQGKLFLILDSAEVERRKHRVIKRRVYESSDPVNTLHGCIDGFSQKLMWLVVSTLNNDAFVIANHFFLHIEASQRSWNRKYLL